MTPVLGERSSPLRVAVIGVGDVSRQYLDTIQAAPILQLVGVAGTSRDRSDEVGDIRGVRAQDPNDLIESADVDVVVNLTVPESHVSVTRRALLAGKHVYTEKPLAPTAVEAAQLMELASRVERRIACAPDTVLGAGVQTAREVVRSGMIGKPFGALATFTAPGHEIWHASPEFFYGAGGGPLLDVGPYMLTALAHILGPVTRVCAVTTQPRPIRLIESGPRAGERFSVDSSVPTHVTSILEHQTGAVTDLLLSFDVWSTRLSANDSFGSPRLEVYGTEGTISVPNPEQFDGVNELALRSERWQSVPIKAGFVNGTRGTGLMDLAEALEASRPHRAAADVAYHVLEIAEAVVSASRERTSVEVHSSFALPLPVPVPVPVPQGDNA